MHYITFPIIPIYFLFWFHPMNNKNPCWPNYLYLSIAPTFIFHLQHWDFIIHGGKSVIIYLIFFIYCRFYLGQNILNQQLKGVWVVFTLFVLFFRRGITSFRRFKIKNEKKWDQVKAVGWGDPTHKIWKICGSIKTGLVVRDNGDSGGDMGK